MRRRAFILSIIVCGTALGLASLYLRLAGMRSSSLVRNGAWETDLSIGSSAAGLATRAAVAIGGLLALNQSETIYFNAWRDDGGEPLSEDCEYRIAGTRLAARWWSITLYASDHFLVANSAQRFSYSATTLEWHGDDYVIAVARDERPGNWLPSSGAGSFSLTARLYNPEPSVYDNPATTPLPRITKVSCR